MYACLDFLKRDWSVTVAHVFREANQVADCLANKALEIPMGIKVLNGAPKESDLIHLLMMDAMGVAWSRCVIAS